jgi:hypothetical protein
MCLEIHNFFQNFLPGNLIFREISEVYNISLCSAIFIPSYVPLAIRFISALLNTSVDNVVVSGINEVK